MKLLLKHQQGNRICKNISKVTNLSRHNKQIKKLDYWVMEATGEASINYNEEDYPNKIVLVWK